MEMKKVKTATLNLIRTKVSAHLSFPQRANPYPTLYLWAETHPGQRICWSYPPLPDLPYHQYVVCPKTPGVLVVSLINLIEPKP